MVPVEVSSYGAVAVHGVFASERIGLFARRRIDVDEFDISSIQCDRYR